MSVYTYLLFRKLVMFANKWKEFDFDFFVSLGSPCTPAKVKGWEKNTGTSEE